MSIASEITRLQTAKADLKTAIEAKGVTVSSSDTLDDYANLVASIPSGGSGPIEKLVNFYDYDGSLVASYSGSEVQALSELPSAPDHSADEVPLTFEEWNWTLSQIKTYNTANPDAIINVGATYHTTDGKIHLFYRITADYDGNGVRFTVNAEGTVDWGDGGAVENFSSGNVEHIYSREGLYHCIVDTSATSFVSGSGTSSDAKFWGKLIEVRLPSSITSIGSNAFSYCYGLQSIVIPSNVTNIGNNAFYYCYSLQNVVISSGVTSIKGNAFSYCYSLQNVVISSGVTSISGSAFSYCNGLQKAVIPSSVTSISGSAFSYCYNLQSIVIPSSVTSLGSYAFSGCSNLKNVVISSGVTSIENNAFSGCSCLQGIVIPSSVTSIGSNAFSSCYSLYSVFIEATTPPTLSNTNAFNTSYTKKIYVPASAVDDYKGASNWSNFASIIEAIPS